MMKRIPFLFALIFCFTQSFAQDLSGRLLFSARLSGQNNTQVTDADAIGLGTFLLNETRDSLYVSIAVSNFDTPLELALIQIGGPGENGFPVVAFDSSVVRNKINTVITDSTLDILIPAMMAGEFYLNTYDENFPPTGTARGQIKLERDFGFFANLDTAQTRPGSDGSQAFGSANFKLDQNGDSLEVKLVTVGLGEDITGVHLHEGRKGLTGPVIFDLTSLVKDGTRIDSIITVPSTIKATLKTLIENNQVYINVHTASNPQGEIRGQVQASTDLYFDVFASSENVTQNPLFASNVALAGHGYLNSSLDTFRYFMAYELDSLSSDPVLASFTLNGVPVHNITLDSGMVSGIWTSSDPQALNPAAVNGFLTNQIGIQVNTSLQPSGELAGTFGRALRDAYVFDLDTNQVTTFVDVDELPLGLGMISVNTRGTQAHYMMAWDNLSGNVMQGSINSGAAGETGPIMFALNREEGGAFGYLTANQSFTTETTALFKKDSAYVRISTMRNPNAELRGNINRSYNTTNPPVVTNIVNEAGNFGGDIVAYPVPATSELNIKLNVKVNEQVNLEVYNSLGSLMLKKEQVLKSGTNVISVSTSTLETGIYVARIIGDNGSVRINFTVK
ncbi:CHRD domain-containing protein [Luteibaculum oceani]|uniref:CHRD domain-containing protein n=1 Tax=Luteibaculum oceani TaxID=1294296 RepID=A0A5C6UQL6_9FLAO|nr:CHRD domain-containing protein [Luteibaculum oceani]TXC75633.1 CHRD domain-containing protein [Luteibaculum oceani]